MIGQTKLLKLLNTLTLDNLPKAVLLLGDKGCGKHTYLNLICEKLQVSSIDITDVVSFEYILQLYSRSIPSIYYIDIDKFTEKKQNIILKLLEEPPVNAYIVLLSSNRSLLLPTIVNRCIIYEFEKYSYQELSSFVESGSDIELICEIYRTPGQILSSNIDNVRKLYELCEKIITRMKDSSYPNSLSISEKINYSDEYDKFDLMAFFNMMNYVILDIYKHSSDENIIKYMTITIDYRRRFEQDNRLDKQRLFENYITAMWKISKGII